MRGLEIPRTHDLDLLTRLLATGTHELPVELGRAKELSPWAVATRYDDMDASLDRSVAVVVAEKSLIWAREQVEVARGEDVG